MSHGNNCQERTFGYLSTLESAEHGYFGGYLIVSQLGRPLEFHCTAPIRPSRAQAILYGPTLRPYLLGDQICRALLEAAKLKPAVVLTDCEAVLQARATFAVPLAVVVAHTGPSGEFNAASGQPIADSASNSHNTSPRQLSATVGEFTLENYRLQLPCGYDRDEQQVVEALALLAKHVELTEPFGRIHEAIREAQRIGGRGTEAHDQAA